MKIKNQSGMTLVEVLFSTVALSIVFLAAIEFAANIRKQTVAASSQRSYFNEYQKIANLVMSDPKLFKITFNPTEAKRCSLLKSGQLPLAWDSKNVYPVDDCTACAGRIGYVIQPYDIPTLRGVYKVTFRITHTTLTKGKKVTCDGQIIEDSDQFETIVGLR